MDWLPLGAVLAAAGGKHLSLATTNFMARSRLRLVCETFSQVVFVAVSLLLTYASARMVAANRGTGDADLLPGGLHRWMVELIIPISFGVDRARRRARCIPPPLSPVPTGHSGRDAQCPAAPGASASYRNLRGGGAVGGPRVLHRHALRRF